MRPTPLPEPAAGISGDSGGTWRADLPEAFRYTIRGLSLPMPGGPRIWDYMYFEFIIFDMKVNFGNKKISGAPMPTISKDLFLRSENWGSVDDH